MAVATTMTITEAIKGFLLDWKIRGRSDATLRLYRCCLMVLARWLAVQGVADVSGMSLYHLRAFIAAQQDRVAGSINPRRPPAADGHPLTASTLQSYVKAIKVFGSWLVDEEIIAKNPAHRLAKPASEKRIVKTLQPHHLDALFAACDCTTSQGFRDFVLMLVLLDTGVRVSELCGLTLDHVFDDHLKVLGKGNKEREVGVSPPTRKYLWKYIHQHRGSADETVRTLFTNVAGRPLSPSGVEKLLRRVRDAAGLDGLPLTAHWFRHTFARTWLERGGEIMHLARVLGHSSVKITEVYLQDFQSRQARLQHTRYSPLGDLKLPKPSRTNGHKGRLYRRPSDGSDDDAGGRTGRYTDERARAQGDDGDDDATGRAVCVK